MNVYCDVIAVYNDKQWPFKKTVKRLFTIYNILSATVRPVDRRRTALYGILRHYTAFYGIIRH